MTPALAADKSSGMDAVLNLLWPGLGQLNQGRTLAGGCFAIEALGLVVLWGAWPEGQAVVGSLVLALTAWSIVDVLGAA